MEWGDDLPDPWARTFVQDTRRRVRDAGRRASIGWCEVVAPPPYTGIAATRELIIMGGSTAGLRAAPRLPVVSRSAAAGPGVGVVVTRSGLQLPRQLRFERWLGVGRELAAVSTSAAWCLGDWLAFGEKAYPGRYRHAIEQTSLDYQTLRNYAWVARQFVMSRRRDTLTFAHHAEVAALPEPEQDFWLRKAEEHQWPVKQLRRQVRASLAERSADEHDDPDPGAGCHDRVILSLHIRLSPGRWMSASPPPVTRI